MRREAFIYLIISPVLKIPRWVLDVKTIALYNLSFNSLPPTRTDATTGLLVKATLLLVRIQKILAVHALATVISPLAR